MHSHGWAGLGPARGDPQPRICGRSHAGAPDRPSPAARVSAGTAHSTPGSARPSWMLRLLLLSRNPLPKSRTLGYRPASGAARQPLQGRVLRFVPTLGAPHPDFCSDPTVVTRRWPCTGPCTGLSVDRSLRSCRSSVAEAPPPRGSPRGSPCQLPASGTGWQGDRLGGVSARPFFPWDKDESFSSGYQGALSSPR